MTRFTYTKFLTNNSNHVRALIRRDRITTKIIDGKVISQEFKDELRDNITKWVQKYSRQPTLVAILVGDDPASTTYVEKKMIAAKYVGIASKTINLPTTSSESEIISEVTKLNQDPNVDGILVQLPLPQHVSERNICNSVTPTKDIDGFHITNIGKLSLNMDTFVPCTTLAVVELLKRAKVEMFGKNVVVCGRSKNVGLPISLLVHSDARNALPGMEATVTLCHRNTPPKQLRVFTKTADILITATGVVKLISPDMVKPGVCIIDVGITRIQTPEGKTKLVGDVDFEGMLGIAGSITPVPGGVGPMTVAMLMQNTFKAAVDREKLNL